MEIDEIENKRRSRVITNEALQVLITNVCCKLDGTDTNGSEGLRCMRKSIINMAHAVAQRSGEIEDKNNDKKSSNNSKPSSVDSPRKKLTLPGYSLGDIPSSNRHMILLSMHPPSNHWILHSSYVVMELGHMRSCVTFSIVITTITSQV